MKNKSIIKALGIISVLLILLGSSYAFFTYLKVSDKKSQLITGEVYLNFLDGEDTINLVNLFPETKEEALARNDNIFTFSITGKNTTKNKDIWYEIRLYNASDVEGRIRFKDSDIAVYLTENINGEEKVVVDGLTFEDFNNHKIWVNKIPANTTEEISITYKLRLWISDEVSISDSEYFARYTTGEYKKKFASVKVSVNGDFTNKEFPADKTIKKLGLTVNNASDGCPVEGEKVTTTEGTKDLLCPYHDDDGPSYYFRGAPTHNYVKWGGFYWRIIRINGDGGIRMIYSGKADVIDALTESTTPKKSEALANGYDDSTTKYTQIGESAFNEKDDNNAYIGLMYGAIIPDVYKTQGKEGKTVITETVPLAYSERGTNYETYWQYGTGYTIDAKNGKITLTGVDKVRTDNNIDGLDILVGKYVKIEVIADTSEGIAIYGKTDPRMIMMFGPNLSSPLIYVKSVNKQNKTLIGKKIERVFIDGLDLKDAYNKTHKNETKSTILKTLETWYEANIKEKAIASQIQDSIYCNDRSLYEPYYGDKYSSSYNSYGISAYSGTNSRSGLGIGTEGGIYGGYYRLMQLHKPILGCKQKNDRFTVSNDKGNKVLTYSIGLITADEVNLAGMTIGWENAVETNYLRTGSIYWTASPYDISYLGNSSVFRLSSDFLNGDSVNYVHGVRPVVSLDSKTFTSSGSGTWDNPYIITEQIG